MNLFYSCTDAKLIECSEKASSGKSQDALFDDFNEAIYLVPHPGLSIVP